MSIADRRWADDDLFADPYVDLDEWRESPVRHRYVHGGFGGTETRFSMYMPPADRYAGRFFQHITPVPDSEYLAQGAAGEEDKIGFSVVSGAYFLETNGGGHASRPGSDIDPTIAAYRANAAAARYSRIVAAQMYGPHRTYGYAYGGSGGGFRTIGGAENTSGVWDGFVPYVIGSPMAIPNVFTVRMHAQRTLREHLERIADATEPGGGDMYEGLEPEEVEALREVTRMGFPPRSWFGHRTMGMHAFPVLYDGVVAADPTYFDDFWTQPGYLGHTRDPSLLRDVVQHRDKIAETIDAGQAGALNVAIATQPGQAGGVDTAWQGAGSPRSVPVAVRLDRGCGVDIMGAELIVLSGAGAGTRLGLLSVHDAIAVFGPAGVETRSSLRPGDVVEVDNRGYLAAQTYHRHQVPEPDFSVWDQFRHPDGTPIYPQRPLLLGPLFAAAAAGTVQTGRFEGKMIVVSTLLDREAFAWQADWYRARVQHHLGARTDDHFRLWFIDNALHGDDEVQENPTHTVSYLGALHQALRDVSGWVEHGTSPPPTTAYEVVDGQVVVPVSAADRNGVQPVVSLTVDGSEMAEVAVGDAPLFRAVAEVPGGAGRIVCIEWDFDGAGSYPARQDWDEVVPAVVERRHTFATPGTYFPAVRVASQRDGDTRTPYSRIQNLARVRVIVG